MERLDFDYVDFELNLMSTEESQPSLDESKCGSVFISITGQYTFACEFCDDRSSDMVDFDKHLQSKHLSLHVTKAEDKSTGRIFASLSMSNAEDNEGQPIASPLHVPGLLSCLSEEEEGQMGKGLYLTDAQSDLFDKLTLYCGICDRTLKTKASFVRHRNEHVRHSVGRSPNTKQRRKADKEVEATENNSKNKKSRGKTTKKTDHYCEKCDRYFGTRLALRDHSDVRHKNEFPEVLKTDQTYLKCRYCRVAYETLSERLSHENTHTGEREPYRCSHCPRAFVNSVVREWHENAHTDTRPYKCQHCPKAFISSSNLNQHVRAHLNIKPHACQYCGKKFNNNSNLKKHERVHTHEKPYQCETCGKRFRVSGQLLYHRKRIHLRIPDCWCEICGKAFFTKSALSNHKAVHSNKRPFECDTCGKRFQKKNTLEEHKRLHSGLKDYECLECGERFAQNAGLYSHRNKHHRM